MNTCVDMQGEGTQDGTSTGRKQKGDTWRRQQSWTLLVVEVGVVSGILQGGNDCGAGSVWIMIEYKASMQ